VAQAGGVVNDLGPQVVAARLAGANQVAVQISFNAAQSLRTLDADAAAGVGWSAIGNGADTRVNATSAQLTGTDTLLLTFSSPLPADAKLYYGYGYGRLAGWPAVMAPARAMRSMIMPACPSGSVRAAWRSTGSPSFPMWCCATRVARLPSGS
jgi:hypothetical protein